MSRNFPIVSIVTPCYNGSSYLHRYFSSVLQQSYPAIQLIFVDDGSTDDTFAIASYYENALKTRGIDFELIHQSNQGQAAALNAGFQKVVGKYITWPDSDDLMMANCIASKVSYLEQHPEKGFVRSGLEIVNNHDIDQVIERQITSSDTSPFIFEDLIYDKSPFYSGIAYMVRTDVLFEAINGRHIYESRGGQNWQILIPLAYTSQCGFIEEPLAKYVIRANSHSRSFNSPEKDLQHVYEQEDILRHILKDLPLSPQEYQYYTHYIYLKYQKKKFWLALALDKRNLIERVNLALDSEKCKYPRIRAFIVLLTQMGLGPMLYQIKTKFSRAMRLINQLFDVSLFRNNSSR